MNFNLTKDVEVDLCYSDNSCAEVSVCGNHTTEWNGYVTSEQEIEFDLNVDEVFEEMSEYDKREMAEALQEQEFCTVDEVTDIDVDDVFEQMNEGQRSHMFNKLLKYGSYSLEHTSVPNLVTALIRTGSKQSDYPETTGGLERETQDSAEATPEESGS